MLRETCSSLANRSIKNRISRIIKELELHGNWTEEKDNEDEFLISGSRLGHRLLRGRHFHQSTYPSNLRFHEFKQLLLQHWKLLYCRRICSRREEPQKRLEEVDVFIGVETSLKSPQTFYLSGFHTYRIDRTHRSGGGIIFLVRKSLKFILAHLCDRPPNSISLFY